jgi:hypothetical protein
VGDARQNVPVARVVAEVGVHDADLTPRSGKTLSQVGHSLASRLYDPSRHSPFEQVSVPLLDALERGESLIDRWGRASLADGEARLAAVDPQAHMDRLDEREGVEMVEQGAVTVMERELALQSPTQGWEADP